MRRRPTSPRAAEGADADRARGQPARLPRLGPAGAADAREHASPPPAPPGRRSCCRARSTTTAPTPSRSSPRTAPQQPVTRKGAIRVAMEARLREAAAAGTPVLVVRAGDFFGPRAGNNWFTQGLVKPGQPSTLDHPARRPRRRPRLGLPARRRRDDGAPRRGRRAARLRKLPHGRPLGPRRPWRWPRRSAPSSTSPTCRSAALPWPLLRLAGPLVPLFRELAEMRYLWRTPVRLDNRRLLATLGEEPRTPLDRAVRETLTGLGCLPVRLLAPLPAREAPRISYRLANLESSGHAPTGA